MKQRVRIIRDLPVIKLVGRQIGPLGAGQEGEFEPWEVAILERHGFAEAIQKLTTVELRKFTLAEERASRPQPLPPNFYSLIAQQAASLRRAWKHDELQELKTAATILTDIRVQKLMQLAASPIEIENLPLEEKFLVNSLAAVLEDWNRWFESLFGKEPEEEVGEREREIRGAVRDVTGDAPHIQKQGVPASDLHA
jgi:hypothetical protein